MLLNAKEFQEAIDKCVKMTREAKKLERQADQMRSEAKKLLENINVTDGHFLTSDRTAVVYVSECYFDHIIELDDVAGIEEEFPV